MITKKHAKSYMYLTRYICYFDSLILDTGYVFSYMDTVNNEKGRLRTMGGVWHNGWGARGPWRAR